MAVEAAVQISVGIGRLVGAEGLVLPFAIALWLWILAPPPGLFLHHGIAQDSVRLDEAAIGVLGRVALRVELSGILHHGDHGTARKRRALLGRVDGHLTGVILTDLLVFWPVEDHVAGGFGQWGGKHDLFA